MQLEDYGEVKININEESSYKEGKKKFFRGSDVKKVFILKKYFKNIL